MLEFDHIAVTAPSLEEGVAAVEAALGVSLGPGGRHAHMATWNRLLSLGPGLYLEVIAPDPAARRPEWPRWFRLDERERVALTNWVVRCSDLELSVAAAPEGAGLPVELERGGLRWRMAVPADGRLPYDDCFPALIQWQGAAARGFGEVALTEGGGTGPAHPANRLEEAGCRLQRLVVTHPEAEMLTRLLPLEDPRVVFETGDRPGLRAEIATPGGIRILA